LRIIENEKVIILKKHLKETIDLVREKHIVDEEEMESKTKQEDEGTIIK
jgi:hypothetical protein